MSGSEADGGEIDAEQATARVESNQANLAAAKISLESARTSLEKNKRDYERQQALMAENATTLEQLLNSETTYENSKRDVARQEQQIKQQEASMRIESRRVAAACLHRRGPATIPPWLMSSR